MLLRTYSMRAARFRGYAVLVFGTGVTRALAFVAAVLLARHLGPARFGEVAIFLTIIGFWASPDFLDSTYVRYAARADDNSGRVYLRGTLNLKLAWNGLLIVLALPLGWVLSNFAFHKPVLLWSITLAIVCGVGLNMLSLRASTFQAREQFFQFAMTTSVFYVLSLAAVVVAVLVIPGTDTTPVYFAYLVASAAVGVYGWIAVMSGLRGIHSPSAVLKEILSFSKWLFGANIGYMITQRLDLFLLAVFASLTAVGEYGVALRVVTVAGLLTGTLAPALLPKAAKTSQSSALVRSYLKHAAVLSGLIIVLLALLWVCAPMIVKMLFGSGYGHAGFLVRIILVGPLAIALYTPLSQLFMRDERPRKMLYLSAIRFVVIGGAGAVLVPAFAATGAAISVALAESAVFVYVCVILRRELYALLRQPSVPPRRDSAGVTPATPARAPR